jgi:Lanthionine synthetase C-like protein
MNTTLFDPTRHEPLCTTPWSEGVARLAIAEIVADTLAHFDAQTLWPTHPRDADLGDATLPAAAIYHGAAGVIWALKRLHAQAMATIDVDFSASSNALIEHNHRFNVVSGIAPHSYLLGDTGVLLLQFKSTHSSVVADTLFALVESNLHNPTQEFLWGSPGTLLAALHMFEMTSDARWQDVFQRGVDILWTQMQPAENATDVWLWTQQMYGRQRQFLGGGHGFVGNVFPIIRGACLLPGAQVDAFVERTRRMLNVTAMNHADKSNWDGLFDALSSGLPLRPLVQDCHGAPGIICRLADTTSQELGALLLRGGELVWAAGPLSKGAGLCHGTAGNGFAFLKLHTMNNDSKWLVRARAFAMHALEQSASQFVEHGQRRYSLWTGDLGVALFVAACINGDSAFPTLDVF